MGTKEFIKRNGQFTVNIGLVAGDSPLAGVVYVPAAADGPVMYKGVKGLGPPVREIDDPLGYDSYKSIFCKTFVESDAGLTVVASASHGSPETVHREVQGLQAVVKRQFVEVVDG